MSNASLPAYPVSCVDDDGQMTGTQAQISGLTKLEIFAMNAPAVPEFYDSNETNQAKRFFAWRAHYAMVMLLELERVK